MSHFDSNSEEHFSEHRQLVQEILSTEGYAGLYQAYKYLRPPFWIFCVHEQDLSYTERYGCPQAHPGSFRRHVFETHIKDLADELLSLETVPSIHSRDRWRHPADVLLCYLDEQRAADYAPFNGAFYESPLQMWQKNMTLVHTHRNGKALPMSHQSHVKRTRNQGSKRRRVR